MRKMRRKPETRFLMLLLAFALWFVVILSISTFTDWGETKIKPGTPITTDSPWWEEQQERYGDEAWQQFSH